MRALLLVFAVIGIVTVLGLYLSSRPRRTPKSESQPRTDGAPRADEFPEPGDPSPHRVDGAPVPGSRDHRREHGKP